MLSGMRTTAGSSPLTRGKLRWWSLRRPPVGLIPAHAGKTRPTERHTQCPPAHPRSRGENDRCAQISWPVLGSSPLTRGKPPRARARIALDGLIPAHAGKTAVTHWRPLRSRAHPRSRGENFPGARSPLHGSGSSPLTRGKLPTWIKDLTRIGLIPAHAGKTYSWVVCPYQLWAHPRSRGENRSMAIRCI